MLTSALATRPTRPERYSSRHLCSLLPRRPLSRRPYRACPALRPRRTRRARCPPSRLSPCVVRARSCVLLPGRLTSAVPPLLHATTPPWRARRLAVHTLDPRILRGSVTRKTRRRYAGYILGNDARQRNQQE